MRFCARRLRGVRFWAGVATLVPAAYVSVTASSGGPAPVLGCGGSGPMPPTGIISIAVPGTSPVAVGLDGFFPALLGYGAISTEEAFAAVTVDVRDEMNVAVPGTLRMLEYERYLIAGWEAEEPLREGQRLSATLSAPNTSGTVTASAVLEVRDATAVLELPSIEMGNWILQTTDTGEVLTCYGSGQNPCNIGMPVTLTFGKDLELLHRGDMSALWSMKPVATAWTFSLEGVDGNGELVNNPYPYEIPIFDDSGFGFPLEFRRAGREDLCVVATVRDLKTGESVSEPICSTPGDMLPEVSDDQIRMCTTVPPELEERRCRALAGTSPGGSSSVGAGGCGSALPPGGAGGMPPSTAAGIGGMPPSAAAGIGGFPPSTAAGAGPNGPTPDAGSGGTASGGDDSSDEDDEAERVITRGCGCSVPERGRSDASMLALALLGAIAAFRRASSPSGIRSSRS